MSDAQILVDLGFVQDEEAKNVAIDNAAAQGLSGNGTYTVHDVYSKGNVIVTIEQNQAHEDLGGGMSALVTHPICAVAQSPRGRVTFNLEDHDAARDVLTWLGSDG